MISFYYSRILFLLLFFFTIAIAGSAQVNCLNMMEENNKVSSIHFLKSKSVPIILRSSHSYRLQLGNGVKGPYIRLFSLGPDKLNKDDEVIFIDQNQRRQTFKFTEENESINERGVNVHFNTLYLSREDFEWFCVNRIDVIFIRFNLLLTMRKFTLEKDRSNELRQLSDCYWKTIDKTMIIDSNVDNKVQASAPPQSQVKSNLPPPTKTKPSDSGVPSTDRELTELNSELEATKKRVKREIELELEKLEQVKRDLSDQVVLAQKQAVQQKESYANEVLDARKKAETELNQIKLGNALAIEESKKNADTRLEEIAAEVASARIKAENEVANIKMEGAKRIQEIRKESSDAIAKLEKDMELTRLKYADEVAEAKSKSLVTITDIRKQVKDYVDSLSASKSNIVELTSMDVQVTKESSAKQIMDVQQSTAAEIGRIMEQKVLTQEKLAIDVAQARKNAESEINNLSENLALQKATLEEALVQERERQLIEIEENRKKALEEIQKSNFIVEQLVEGNRKKTDSLLIAENQKVTLQLDSLKKVRASIDEVIKNELTKSELVRDSLKNVVTSLNKESVKHQNMLVIRMDSLALANKDREELFMKELQQKVVERQKKLERFNDSLNNIEVQELAEFEDRKRERREELVNEFESAKIVSQNKMKAIQTELDLKIEQINKEKVKNLELQSGEFDSRMKTMQEKLAEEEISSAKRIAEIRRNLASEEEAGLNKISERKNQIRQQLDSLNNSMNQKISAEIKNYSNRKEVLEKSLDSLKQSNEVAYRNYLSDHQARINKLDSIENAKIVDSNRKIVEAKLNSAEQINKIIEYKQEEIDVMENQFQQAILNIENNKGKIIREQERQLEEINLSYSKRRDSLLTIQTMEIMASYEHTSSVKDSLESVRQELISNLHQELSDEKDKLSKDVYEARRLAIDQINEIKRTTLEQRDELEATIKEREEYLKDLENQILEKEKTLKKN